jgi:hypothetical protein
VSGSTRWSADRSSSPPPGSSYSSASTVRAASGPTLRGQGHQSDAEARRSCRRSSSVHRLVELTERLHEQARTSAGGSTHIPRSLAATDGWQRHGGRSTSPGDTAQSRSGPKTEPAGPTGQVHLAPPTTAHLCPEPVRDLISSDARLSDPRRFDPDGGPPQRCGPTAAGPAEVAEQPRAHARSGSPLTA